jgi:hypothetical protein
LQRFVKRHPDLITPRQAQGLADKRKTRNMKESVQRFVAMLERHIGPHAGPKSAWCWQPHVVVNADETRFGYSDESTLVLAPKNTGKVSTPVYRDPTTLTVVHPQAAAPWRRCVWCLQADLNSDHSLRRPNVSARRYSFNLEASYTALREHFSARAIVKSFSNTGLYPFDADRIWLRFKGEVASSLIFAARSCR